MRCARLFGAAVLVGMQVAIALTGNYALVHPVSIVPLFALVRQMEQNRPGSAKGVLCQR